MYEYFMIYVDNNCFLLILDIVFLPAEQTVDLIDRGSMHIWIYLNTLLVLGWVISTGISHVQNSLLDI
jgi:hypothetical protein